MNGAAPPADEEIVRRVLSGDAAAARVLFDRHLPRLRATVRRRVPAAARGKFGESDVIQDAYLAAYLHLGDFEDRGGGSFARWLRRILDRKIADEVREHVGTEKRDARREVRLSTGTGDAAPSRGRTTPSEFAMASEESLALRVGVEGLSEDHRAVIHLVHRDGLTLVQAAARMGRSADAVRKLYGRAMARLAARMGGTAGESG